MSVIDRDDTPRKDTRLLTDGEIERAIAGIGTGLEMDGVRFTTAAEAAARSVITGEGGADEPVTCRSVGSNGRHKVHAVNQYPRTKANRKLLGHNISHIPERSIDTILAKRMAELTSNPIKGRFNFTHMQAIHKYLFHDLYEWAGTLRITDARPCFHGVLYVPPTTIPEELLRAFNDINSGVYLNHHTREHFVRDLSRHWGDLTTIRPFRGGNAATQMVFFDHLAGAVGWAVEWRMVNTPAAQAASHFAYVDGGKTLADILRPAINLASQTPPESTATHDTALAPDHHWEAMIKHHDTMPEQPYI